QVFTGDALHGERHRRSVAVEPMTCPPDAFRSGRDVVSIEPGETWHGSWGIRPGRVPAGAGPGGEPMGVAEVVRRRRMVRNYDPDRPVTDELIDRLLDCAIRAPSAGFSQGWGFLVLTDPDDRARFWKATTPEDEGDEPDQWLLGLQRAPVLIV